MYKNEVVVRHHGGDLVRVFQGINGFRGHYGAWPTKLHLGLATYWGLSEHLTEFGMQLLKSKIQIEIDKNNPSRISASDDLARTLDYGWHGEKPDIDAYQWLDVERL
jgi:hypothetical protein